jgi:hypothetical protein
LGDGRRALTGAQRSYLKTLSEEAKKEFDDTLTKAEASRRIDDLQEATGRRGVPISGANARTEPAPRTSAKRTHERTPDAACGSSGSD